jgi:hypothetical protein
MGYEILTLMDGNEDLPLPNIGRLAKTMQEYFNREGMFDLVGQEGYKWKPDIKYWEQNIGNISDFAAKEYKKYFGFLRTNGLKGIWTFMGKAQYEQYLQFHHQDIATRVENQNEKIENAEAKWQIAVPRLNEVPRLA